jgi:transcriptional regulator with XRE-family HTH domain
MAGLPGLRAQREKRGLLQVDLSRLAKLSVTTISDLENRKAGTRLATMEKLAAALNCAPADLLTAPAPREEDAMPEIVVADSS